MRWSWSAAGVASAAGIGGIAVPAVGVAIVPIWDFPGTGVSAHELTTFVTGQRAALQVTMLLYSIGVLLWLVFGVATAAHLSAGCTPRSSRTDVLVLCLAAASVGFVTLLLAGFTCFDVLVYRAPHVADPRVLYDLAFGLLAMSGLPTAVAMLSFALLARGRDAARFGTVPLAVVGAVAHLALLVSLIVPRGAASLEGLSITVVPALLWAWILLTGLALRPRAGHGERAAVPRVEA